MFAFCTSNLRFRLVFAILLQKLAILMKKSPALCAKRLRLGKKNSRVRDRRKGNTLSTRRRTSAHVHTRAHTRARTRRARTRPHAHTRTHTHTPRTGAFMDPVADATDWSSVVPGIRYQEHALSQNCIHTRTPTPIAHTPHTPRTGAFMVPVADATDWRR